MSNRYGNPLESNRATILPTSNGDRYSRHSTQGVEPIQLNGDIKIENGKVYVENDCPMAFIKGNYTIAVDLTTQKFKVTEV